MLPKRIVAIGASIVLGRVDPEHGGFIGRLKTWHEKKFIANVVFNLGISSETSAMLLKRLYLEASIRKPDLMIISIGLNDLKRSRYTHRPVTSIKKFSQNIRGIIRQSKKLCNIIFVSITPVDERKIDGIKKIKYFRLLDDVKKYSDITKKICTEEKIPYLDIMNQWLVTNYQKFLFKDGVHPNSLGHDDIYRKLISFLKKYCS